MTTLIPKFDLMNGGTTPANAINRPINEKLAEIVSVKDFGAVGDGVTDDAAAIEATVLAVFNAGGGTVYIPAGTYLLGTLSSDSNAHVSYIVPRNNVNIVGDGIGATILKVANGQNALYSALNKPNIIATSQALPLTNCSFSDITFDWNGANNLLTSGMAARQNASIMSLKGGINILCKRVEVKETPGNQCIFFRQDADQGQSTITVRDCIFRDNGSALTGNYNNDHSSVYLMGADVMVDNNSFINTAQPTGFMACYELHGFYNKARNNYSLNYSQGFWVGSDYAAITDILVDGDSHNSVTYAFAFSAPTYAINQVKVINSTFNQVAGLSTIPTESFILGGYVVSSCNFLEIDNCSFNGQNYATQALASLYKISNFYFTNNYAQNFAQYGIRNLNVDLGSSTAIGVLKVQENVFTNVNLAIYFNSPTLSAGPVAIQNNVFNATSSTANAAITLAFSSSSGNVSNNFFNANYTNKTAGVTNGIGVDIIYKNTTVNRPLNVFAGLQYFDTTLDADGKPIWYTGTAWVDATGAVV